MIKAVICKIQFHKNRINENFQCECAVGNVLGLMICKTSIVNVSEPQVSGTAI